MTWLSGGELHAGAWTSSNYPGFGILFENLPTTGESGGSPLLNDGGVNGDEVRWELLSQTGLTVDAFYEDGSFESTGIGSFTYRSFVNNSSVGDFTVFVNAAGIAYSITCETVSDAHTVQDALLYRGYTLLASQASDSHQAQDVAFYRGYNLVADAVSDVHNAAAITLTYTTPEGTAYSITCESVSDNHQASAIAFNRGYVMRSDGVTDNHLALPVTLRYSGEQIVFITTYSVNYKQDIISASYKPTLIEVTYGGG